jgi:hypothetical protein
MQLLEVKSVLTSAKWDDADFKIGAGLNAIIGGEVSINFSQMGRAASRTGQELKKWGGYLTGVFFPDTGTLERKGPPDGFTPLRPFIPLR